MIFLQKDQELDCTVEKLVYEGYGLARHQKHVIFIPKTVPGDVVKVRIRYKKRRSYFAEVVSFITPSSFRSSSRCPHAAACGGCQLVDVPYEDQLKIKQDIVHDVFKRLAPSLLDSVKAVVPADCVQYHRNKMEFSFYKGDAELALGLKKKQSFSEVISISDCHLFSKESNDIVAFTRQFFEHTGLSVWDSHTQSGCLRHVMMRHSKHLDQYMLVIEAASDEAIFSEFSKVLCKQFPKVVSVYSMIVKEKKGSPTTKSVQHLLGATHIIEAIGDLTFKISPLSFFQTNSYQVKVLYDLVKKSCELDKSSTLLDLYCGTGSIGLYCADAAAEVIGIEEVPDAILDAKENATNNGISNATFIEGRVKNILKFNDFDVDCVVIDPPRAGMVPKALKRVAALACKQLVYVSCNPVTLSRDLLELCKLGYAVDSITPVDMFPHSYHIETVVKLRLDALH